MAITIAASARQNTEPSHGSVIVQDGVIATVCNKKDEQFTIEGSKKPVQLPIGKYHIKSWSLKRTDKNGTFWELKAEDIIHQKSFNVAKNAKIKLLIGEPVISILTVKKDGSEFYFRHYFKGRLGEKIELTKNQSRPDTPKLLIRNADGSYQESLTFKYG
jgi:ribosomal protein L24E